MVSEQGPDGQAGFGQAESTAGVLLGHCTLGPGTHCLSGFPKRLTVEAEMWTELPEVEGHKSFSL